MLKDIVDASKSSFRPLEDELIPVSVVYIHHDLSKDYKHA